MELSISLDYFTDSLLSTSRDTIRELLWMLTRIDYTIGDLLIQSKTRIDEGITKKLVRTALVFDESLSPANNFFIASYRDAFYNDFLAYHSQSIPLTLEDCVLTTTPNENFPTTLMELHQRIGVWKKLLEGFILASHNYAISDARLKDLSFILHQLRVPSSTDTSTPLVRIRSLKPALYEQPYQNRVFETVDRFDKRTQFSIQFFQPFDLLFTLTASYLEFSIAALWNHSARCRRRRLGVQTPHLIPVNYVTGFVEHGLDDVNLYSIWLTSVKENHLDPEALYLSFVEKKQEYCVDRSHTALEKACHCELPNGLLSYVYMLVE